MIKKKQKTQRRDSLLSYHPREYAVRELTHIYSRQLLHFTLLNHHRIKTKQTLRDTQQPKNKGKRKLQIKQDYNGLNLFQQRNNCKLREKNCYLY